MIFPIDPILKIAHFWQRHILRQDVFISELILQWRSTGNFCIFCRVQLKVRLRVHKKTHPASLSPNISYVFSHAGDITCTTQS